MEKDQEALLDLSDRSALRASQEAMDLKERQDQPVSMEPLVVLDPWVRQDHQEFKEKEVPLDLRDIPGPKAILACPKGTTTQLVSLSTQILDRRVSRSTRHHPIIRQPQ